MQLTDVLLPDSLSFISVFRDGDIIKAGGIFFNYSHDFRESKAILKGETERGAHLTFSFGDGGLVGINIDGRHLWRAEVRIISSQSNGLFGPYSRAGFYQPGVERIGSLPDEVQPLAKRFLPEICAEVLRRRAEKEARESATRRDLLDRC